jgi:hypothetical protein
MFDGVEKTSTALSMMTGYLSKINGVKYAGKCYDDTLREEGTIWNNNIVQAVKPMVSDEEDGEHEALDNIAPEVIAFWGVGFTANFYEELERKYKNWISRLGREADEPGEQVIHKQICILEATINRDTAAGKPIDKHVNSLNSLLGSANLKPQQKKRDEANAGFDNTPFGVWIRKWEDTKPIPDTDPELREGDGIIKYISTWFVGHIGRMLGIKNLHSKLYEDEMEKYRVDMPEYESDDDETLFNNIFGGDAI